MSRSETSQLIRMAIAEMYEDKRSEFESFGEGVKGRPKPATNGRVKTSHLRRI